MSATTDRPASPRGSAQGLPARLALKSEGPPRGLLDGAWWPRSRELSAELPALAAALDHRWGRITRAAVNPRHWPDVPRKVTWGGRVMKVGWFDAELDPHTISLVSQTGRRELLVIPPEAGAPSAERLMAGAIEDEGPPRTASALMAGEEARAYGPAPGGARDSEEAWEDEGGARKPPTGTAPTP
ncbi:DUF5994 family protein [Streptomyces sp. DSM 44917]|uniref:DUF5994 family protein n=1 Tax=Streptomyces boetiae TaxID=3075541 RepID=A0ABU2LAS6_9ACTN|nr:DUF5994 family protein [Streptomyces sp. DSM 44917]MDT0308437.1 DUF5994 family protein [Streptomyces sp. DSM 44917]